MGRVFLYVPFPNDIVASSDDGYVKGMIEAYQGAGHPAAQLKYPGASFTWTTTKPAGEEPFVTPIQESEAVEEVWHGMSSGGAGTARWAQRVSGAFFGKKLKDLVAADMLFLVGHSSYQGGYLVLKKIRKEGSRKLVDRYWVRVDVLAQLLKAEGLPLSHRWIKLNSCYGGGSDELDRALAKDLAIQLRRLGYADIRVGGYQYLTTVGQNNELSISAPLDTLARHARWGDTRTRSSERLAALGSLFSTENNPASELVMYEKDPYRCWYDGSGSCVRWNVPDAYYTRVSVEHGYTTTRSLIGLLAETDPAHAKWRAKKTAEAAWIEAMERVYRKP